MPQGSSVHSHGVARRHQPVVGPSRTVRFLVRPMTKPLNPLILRFAGRRHVPMIAQIGHAGRRSGHCYLTPVAARRIGDRVLIPLTFGDRADWARNVRASGGCSIRLGGEVYRATSPEVLLGEEAAAARRSGFNPTLRLAMRLLGISGLMQLRIDPPNPIQQGAKA